MLRFEVRALAKDGVVALNLDATDARAAAQLAAERGYAVLSVARRAAPRRGRDRFALVLFTQELLALLRAGLGLVEAIQALAERQTGTGTSGPLDAVLRALRDGHPLSTALKVAPAAFPPIYVETVRAAERTGALVEALERYVAFQIQVERIRQQLVSASIYPLLLIAVGTLVALFLLGYVVPRFSGIYTDMGRELPLASRLLFELGGVIDRHAVGVAVAALALAAGAALLVRSGALRAAFDRAITRAPVLGAQLAVYRLTRFYRTTSMLLRGGMPLVQALDLVAGLLDPASRVRLELAARQVRDGGALSNALESNALTTPIAARMLRVGERSGDLGGLMERAAAFHEEELGRWVERATRMIEPLLMLLIGLLIGAIVVLMYMPIFDLAGSLQ